MSDGADYRVEVDSLVRVLVPLADSVTAAKRIKNEKDELQTYLKDPGAEDVRDSGQAFLEQWGYGMGQLVQYAEEIVTKLNQTIEAYQTAEEYGIKGFTPSDDNLSMMPTDGLGKKVFRGQQLMRGDKQPSDGPNGIDNAQRGFEDWAFG
ncbi:hypothetical protein OG301_15605 [Streptomyces platensis]|uniref:WXG100 family type VII secretion target n=1 Tax=Streptomyces platensis TaxID=58346 RepID=UPI002ED4B07D|nr:hypothetical protein OG301_15605 [Streptomyces platensis]